MLRNKRMNNKKKLAIAGVSAIGITALGLGTYAYFSDSVENTHTAEVGTVDIEVTNNKLTHSGSLDNMNPGDNDPDVPGTNRPGTDHELSFTVNNVGNKSVITRTVITVSGTSAADATPIGTDDLSNIILSEKSTYSANASTNDSDKSTAITKLTPYGTDDNALVYVIGGARNKDVLNGSGDNAETETVSSTTSLNKTFDIGLEKEVTPESPLMGANLTFKVEVQAMQYRNTGDNDWNTIFEETYNTSIS